MNSLAPIGRLLLITGAVIALAGAFLMLYRGPMPLGHLPGDIAMKRDNFSFYFPITTGILLSLVLSLVIWIVARLAR